MSCQGGSGWSEGPDPDVAFILSPSEQLHARLNQPNSVLQLGIPANVPVNIPPAGIRRSSSQHIPWSSKGYAWLGGCNFCAFSNAAWESDYRTNSVSLGTVVIAARHSAASSLINCNPTFLAFNGMGHTDHPVSNCYWSLSTTTLQVTTLQPSHYLWLSTTTL